MIQRWGVNHLFSAAIILNMLTVGLLGHIENNSSGEYNEPFPSQRTLRHANQAPTMWPASLSAYTIMYSTRQQDLGFNYYSKEGKLLKSVGYL